jgi:hypothetical protein
MQKNNTVNYSPSAQIYGSLLFGAGDFVAHPRETSYTETPSVSQDRRAAYGLTR